MTNRDAAVASNRASFALVAGAGTLFLLALGHTISNLVRTMPAVSTDVIADSLSVSAGEVAALTGIYHLAFAAGQIPVGVALDRYSVRAVFLVLIATIVVGALITATAPNSAMFLVGQAVLGLGCSGMLLCPLTYAARHQNSANFALWSAFILAVGNSGMLLSASPMAWVIDAWSWRTGFLVPVAMAVVVAAIAWFRLGRDSAGTAQASSIRSEFAQVVHIGWSPKLRGVIALAFVSFAVVIGIRGVWSGPWLMDVRGLSRIEAGNVMLALTVMLIVMPMLVGLIDRSTKRTNLLLVGGHILAGLLLLLLPLGSAAGLPTLYDFSLLVLFGIAVSVQPLLFALGRQSVDPAHTGKALAAVNLAFFAGAAVIQVLSAPVAWLTGIGGVVTFLGLLSTGGAVIFALRSRRCHSGRQK
ncbi:MAG TPA: MFS transporter [Devosia sp.]|jgi:predicted MFS family arabinose efflux permease|nr:MFS transporter [Devosia sp.]